MRRGCVQPMSPAAPRPSARQIFGICVVFPEPVSPQTIVTGWSRIERRDLVAVLRDRKVVGIRGPWQARETRGAAGARALDEVREQHLFPFGAATVRGPLRHGLGQRGDLRMIGRHRGGEDVVREGSHGVRGNSLPRTSILEN